MDTPALGARFLERWRAHYGPQWTPSAAPAWRIVSVIAEIEGRIAWDRLDTVSPPASIKQDG